MVYWCEHCRIPIIGRETCSICSQKGVQISINGVCNPVFMQEKKLLSLIWGVDVRDHLVWYLGGGSYLVDGERKHLPFVKFYREKCHLEIAELLRENRETDDVIPNQDLFLAANESYIIEKIFEAEDYTKRLYEELTEDPDHSRMVSVSFSGGKDSTAVSRIVRDALQSEKVIHYFGNTTLEFPTTYKYVEQEFRNENPFTPLLPSETENDFYNLCKVFGPPSKFERWCCTIFKTSNLNYELQNLVGDSISFLGIRRSESKERQNYERTQKDSKIGSQINAMPLIDWKDCDVWLYILYKHLAFNEAYRWGYKRVGCFCCPNNSDWSTMLTEIYYPELSEKWKGVLYDFAQKTGKSDPEDYVENGKWKARRGASGLTTRNVTITDTSCNLSDRARNVIIPKKITRDVLEFLKPFGRLEVFDKEDATYISIQERDYLDPKGNVIVPGKKVGDLIITFGTNVVKVLPEKGVDPLLLVNRIKCQLRKYQFCIRCTACDSVCPYGAITSTGKERYRIDESKCKQNLSACSKCIAKFYNGCITCQVLAGKKEIPVDDNIDM